MLRYTPAVPHPSVTVVVSDAHIGQVPKAVVESFHRFLAAVPDLGDHLLINGDLFEFWFEYHHVIPRLCFPTLAALAQLRSAGIAITLTGGNHDRWGVGFWENELGARFYPMHAELELAGWRTWVSHGDGMGEIKSGSRLLHSVTRHPLTERLFRLIHPDLGFALVRRMSNQLARRRSTELIDQHAMAQADFARDLLQKDPDLDLVVMGHTHRATLEPVAQRRWYLNPGAWCDGNGFALISEKGPELKTFG